MKVVADIGGTNARFALVGPQGLLSDSIRRFRNADFDGFGAVAALYLGDMKVTAPEALVVAVAGPVKAGSARLTNLDWDFCESGLAQDLGAGSVRLINDLTALGYAASALGADQLSPIQGAAPFTGVTRQALVVGIGTGFNVSPVIRTGAGAVCPSVEAGHVSLPLSVAERLRARIASIAVDFPTVEHLFSGRGLQVFLDRLLGTGHPAAEQIARYGAEGAAEAKAALDLYAELVGLLLRDLSLAYLPVDGILLAGGVARPLLSCGAGAVCAEVLNRPSRFLAQPIPAALIVEDAAALMGCAALAEGL